MFDTREIFEKKLVFIKPHRIVCPTSLTRLYYDDKDIKSLADNIAVIGIIEPLIVRKNELSKYELVCGLRRLKAAKLIGLRRVPCILLSADEETAAYISLSENIKRYHLNYFEEAKAISSVISQLEVQNYDAAERLGITRSALINKLNLINISENIQEKMVANELPEAFARVLLILPEEKRELFIDKVISDSLNLIEAKELAERFVMGDEQPAYKPEEKPEEHGQMKKVAVGDMRIFTNSISKLVTTLQSSGIESYSKKTETEKYIEYKIRIQKVPIEEYKQLRFV